MHSTEEKINKLCAEMSKPRFNSDMVIKEILDLATILKDVRIRVIRKDLLCIGGPDESIEYPVPAANGKFRILLGKLALFYNSRIGRDSARLFGFEGALLHGDVMLKIFARNPEVNEPYLRIIVLLQ